MKRITITRLVDWGEFRVPGPDGTEAQAYYTDDREDAIGTARAIYGPDVRITFRSKRDFELKNPGHRLNGGKPRATPRSSYDEDGDLAWDEDKRTSTRGNPAPPPGAPQATKTFESFNDYPSKGTFKFDREIVVPERMPVAGPCKWVTYKSDKWGDGTHDYIHKITSYPRVKCALVGGDFPERTIPAKIRSAKTLSQIGLRALGFAYDQDGEEVEAKVPRGTEWFWSQSGRALYLIHNKRKLVAVIWGGKLNVEPRGIVG
jgi:hypothetical protein